MSAVSSSNTAFALELFRTLSQTNPAGNILVSPLSIGAALATVYEGAKGDTAAQITQVSSLSLLEKELTQERLNEWTDRKNMSTHSEVVLHLPKFKLEEDYELNDPLAKLGMKDVFCAGRADLSGMNGEPGLFLSTMAHKVFAEVNEEGTEATAATGAMIKLESFIPDTHFTADHPFLFFIRYNETKSILFFGRFSSPE
ncbi:leukocyte elastase inhibitor-like [Pundamilia nyererei]|uniref:Leukocyte elastase inhibitor-like n=1 Tax=Pundamilia nyererei TaxID=303518 RepID=A0A9Y3S6J8_9CICH|nr:PREDICTED: leukocyte elastase inhibitor-like [Pundamilia nyererei]